QHADHELESVQRLSHPLRQRGGRDARGAAGRHALPHAVPGSAPPLRGDLHRQYRSRAGAPAPALAVRGAVMSRRRREIFGQSMTTLCGGALALNLLLIVALLGLIAHHGLATFWPRDLERFVLRDGRVLLGEVTAEAEAPARSGATGHRLQLRVGNRDLGAADFLWIDETGIAERSRPRDAVLLERLEW